MKKLALLIPIYLLFSFSLFASPITNNQERLIDLFKNLETSFIDELDSEITSPSGKAYIYISHIKGLNLFNTVIYKENSGLTYMESPVDSEDFSAVNDEFVNFPSSSGYRIISISNSDSKVKYAIRNNNLNKIIGFVLLDKVDADLWSFKALVPFEESTFKNEMKDFLVASKDQFKSIRSSDYTVDDENWRKYKCTKDFKFSEDEHFFGVEENDLFKYIYGFTQFYLLDYEFLNLQIIGLQLELDGYTKTMEKGEGSFKYIYSNGPYEIKMKVAKGDNDMNSYVTVSYQYDVLGFDEKDDTSTSNSSASENNSTTSSSNEATLDLSYLAEITNQVGLSYMNSDGILFDLMNYSSYEKLSLTEMKAKVSKLNNNISTMIETINLIDKELKKLIPLAEKDKECEYLLWELQDDLSDYAEVKVLLQDALKEFKHAASLSTKDDVRGYCFGGQDLISTASHDILDSANKIMDYKTKTHPCK